MSPEYVPWSRGYFAFMLVMWIVMMIGMMTPSVAPMILLYAAIARQNSRTQTARPCFAPPGWFLAGYLLAWAASRRRDAVAVVARMAGAGDPDDGRHQPRAGGIALIAAGAISMVAGQTGLPGFLPRAAVFPCNGMADSSRARADLCGWGSCTVFYCIGCCWVLMLSAVRVGVMNLTWMPGSWFRAAGEGVAVATRRGARRRRGPSPRRGWRSSRT
jgi:predicted metal-binding membrane protein